MEIRATTTELLSRINAGWEELQAYLAGLSEEAWTVPTDAAGWTVKDHLMHIAVWEDGIEALLRHQSRIGRMGLPEVIWDGGEIDEINGYLKDLHASKSLAEVRQVAEAIHQRFVSTIGSLSDDEINLPYKHYDPSVDRENPVFGWVVGNSYEHYAEHIPWMQAIIAKA